VTVAELLNKGLIGRSRNRPHNSDPVHLSRCCASPASGTRMRPAAMLCAPARLQHHAQDAVDAEPGVPEALTSSSTRAGPRCPGGTGTRNPGRVACRPSSPSCKLPRWCRRSGAPSQDANRLRGALSPPQHPGALSAGRRGRGEHTQRRERGSPTQSHHRSPFLGGRSLHADALVVTDTRTAKSLTHLLRAGHRWQRNVSSLRMSQPPSDWEVRGFSECRVRRISGSIWHFLCGLVAT
jgi:hypothetical protein